MRGKTIGILICCLQLALAGCQQKSEEMSQSGTTQNISRASGQSQQSAETGNAAIQPSPPAVTATASPSVSGSPAMTSGEESSTAANTASQPSKADPCNLIKSAEIERVQGEPVKETKASDQTSESLMVSQCLYNTATYSNSISLEITRSRQEKGGQRTMREFWDQKFHEERDAEREREREGEAEREREANKPMRIKGLGDEAFWIRSAVGGALYVLKNDAFFRISIGGTGTDQTKVAKARALALEVVRRL